MIDHDSLVHDTNELDPLPVSVIRMLTLLSSDDWSIQAVVSTAALDAALTARILRAANSAASISVAPVATLEESTMRLGAAAVVKLAIGSAIRRYMSAPQTVDDKANEQALWRQSVATALAADQIAALSSTRIPQEAYTVALLSDIGRLVLARYLDSRTLALLGRAVTNGNQDPLAAEQELLGVDHAELGALIADHWKLPSLIVDGIRYHHTPMNATDVDVRALGDVITVADAVAHVIVGDEASSGAFDYMDSVERLGLDDATFERLCDSVGERLDGALSDYE